MIVNFKKDRFPIPAHQAIKGEFVLAGLVRFDIREPHSRVALQTGSIQQRIDPPLIQRGVPQLTLPQHFSPPLLGLDGAMKPLIYNGETFRNYQQEIVERFSMEMAERHHAVNKVNRCGRRYGRCGGLRNRPVPPVSIQSHKLQYRKPR